MKTRVGAGVALLGLVALTGCGVFLPSPPPVTTHVGDSGEEVTLEWVDYPAHAGIDGTQLIDYPDQAELEPVARALLDNLRISMQSAGARLTSDAEADWFGDANWFPQAGNGYGGSSLLTTVNCCGLQADAVPAPEEWSTLIDAASAAVARHGLGEFVIDTYAESCSGEVGCWLWTATATDGVQWVYMSIQDADLDGTGEAAREVEQYGWPAQQITLSYGATVVRAGEKAAFAEAIAPFLGQPLPEGTTSD